MYTINLIPPSPGNNEKPIITTKGLQRELIVNHVPWSYIDEVTTLVKKIVLTPKMLEGGYITTELNMDYTIMDMVAYGKRAYRLTPVRKKSNLSWHKTT